MNNYSCVHYRTNSLSRRSALVCYFLSGFYLSLAIHLVVPSRLLCTSSSLQKETVRTPVNSEAVNGEVRSGISPYANVYVRKNRKKRNDMGGACGKSVSSGFCN